MDILTLDSSLNPVKYLRYINLQWDRKYHEFGEFSVQIAASDYDVTMEYIYTADRPEMGMIQKREYTTESQGNFMQLSGFFYEYALTDKLVYPIYKGTGTYEKIARELFTNYKKDIPISLGAESGIAQDSTALQESNADLGNKLYTFLETAEMSYRCKYDYVSGETLFSVWKGLDRTQSQRENSFVTFSDGMGTLDNTDYVIDSSNYKNYAVVVGNGEYEDGNQITVYVDHSAGDGNYQKQLFVDKKQEHYDSSTQTLADYKAILSQAGEEKLLDYVINQTLQFDMNMSNYVYMTDYDLGDKCEVIIDAVQVAFTARITEIYEVFKGNQHTITLTLGDKVPTTYQKARF